MTWTAPMTAVANTAFTADQFNINVRDNLLETAPGKATTNGGYFVATGVNAIAQRIIGTSFIGTAQPATSSTFSDLASTGPTVTVTTGTHALILFKAHVQHNTDNAVSAISCVISGATSSASTFDRSAQTDGVPLGNKNTICGFKYETLNAGSNTFKMQYYTNTGTATFERRELVVIPL